MLSHLILSAALGEKLRGVKLTHHGPALSHRCFLDDLLLFGFASKKQAYIMEEVIKKFCRQSGQRVNVEKSQLTFSANVQPEIALGLSTSFGTSVSQSLGTYLAYLSFTNV